MFKNGKKIDNAYKGDIICIPIKDKVNINDIVVKTTDYNQLKELNKKINIDKKINIKGNCILKVGYPIKFNITDYKNNVEVISDYIVEEAKNNANSIVHEALVRAERIEHDNMMLEKNIIRTYLMKTI